MSKLASIEVSIGSKTIPILGTTRILSTSTPSSTVPITKAVSSMRTTMFSDGSSVLALSSPTAFVLSKTSIVPTTICLVRFETMSTVVFTVVSMETTVPSAVLISSFIATYGYVPSVSTRFETIL